MAIGLPRRGNFKYVIMSVAVVAAALIAGVRLLGEDRGPDYAGQVKAAIRELRAKLDLLLIEYSEGVRDGIVVLRSEYEASRRLVSEAISLFKEVEPIIASVDPNAAKAIGDALEELDRMVSGAEDPDKVKSIVDSIIAVLNELEPVLVEG